MVLTEDEVLLERCEKFLSKDYWTDINIQSQLQRSTHSLANLQCIELQPEEPHYSFEEIRAMFGSSTSTSRSRSCALGESFGPSWATVWFHLSFALPESWLGESIAFRWDSSSEAMLYTDKGRHIQAFTGGDGEDRRDECILTLSASSEDLQGEVYIEMACNGMFGNGNNGLIRPPDPNRRFPLLNAELVSVNVPVRKLFWDMHTLYHLVRASKDTATRASILRVLNGVINRVDLGDLASLEHCASLLDECKTKAGEGTIDHEITAVGHCHIDTAWLWPYKETRRKIARSWSSQLHLMDLYPDWKFVASQTVQWEWLEQDHPLLFQRILKKVEENRFIPIGGSYVEFDANIPSSESMIRQFLYGQQYYQSVLHASSDVFWLPDTFGYSAQLPQIMQGFGIKYFLSQKLSWNLFNKFPHTTFRWQGLDGTAVIAHFPPADTYNSSASPEDVLKCVDNHKSLKSSNRSMLLFGHGDGGGGPSVSHLEQLSRLKKLKGVPRILTDNSPSAFFEALEKDFFANKPAVRIPTWSGELYLELHQVL